MYSSCIFRNNGSTTTLSMRLHIEVWSSEIVYRREEIFGAGTFLPVYKYCPYRPIDVPVYDLSRQMSPAIYDVNEEREI